jgi:hypothetical protein
MTDRGRRPDIRIEALGERLASSRGTHTTQPLIRRVSRCDLTVPPFDIPDVRATLGVAEMPSQRRRYRYSGHIAGSDTLTARTPHED